MKYLLFVFLFLPLFAIGQKYPLSITLDSSTSWINGKDVPSSVIRSTRLFRERLLADPYRPGYHFAVSEDNALPGDPNGAFYYNGRYHLMYLYYRNGFGFSWGHVSSHDLLHWRHHKDALIPGEGDDGIFSGGAYVDQKGKATLSYWQYTNEETMKNNLKLGTKRSFGIRLAESSDPHFDNWVKYAENPVIASTEYGINIDKKNGKERIYGSADPSNIWMKDGKYYMLTGNILVLNKYGRDTSSRPEMQGDHSYLFVSDDMKKWEYLHEFYQSDRKWTDKSEDNMCANFLPLPMTPDGGSMSDKHLLLYISHNKGCQYYIGDYRNDKFFPTIHERMTWKDNAYFAPEALIDNKGRQIMWSWVFDDRPDSVKRYTGYTGVYGLPRSLWLSSDGSLGIRPIEELKKIRQQEIKKSNISIKAGSDYILENIGKELMELEITVEPGTATEIGVKVACSEDGREETIISFDAAKQTLNFDATHSSLGYGRKIVESAPLRVKTGEFLTLRIFMDRSIIEVFANDRQAIGRSIYPTLGGQGIKIFSKGGDVKVKTIKAWELMPTNPY